MALPAPDMSSCCKKNRCLDGVNAGQVYDICKPCNDGFEFDADLCDCISRFGTYKLTQVATDQAISGDSTTCYIIHFDLPFYDSNGLLNVKTWFYSRTDFTYLGDPTQAIIDAAPNGPAEGLPLNAPGPGNSNLVPLEETITGLITLSDNYCSGEPAGSTKFAQHTSGTIVTGTVVENSYIIGTTGIGLPTISTTCGAPNKTGTVVSTIQYLGPGDPEDYYNSNELVDSSRGLKLVDANTGANSCHDPTLEGPAA